MDSGSFIIIICFYEDEWFCTNGHNKWFYLFKYLVQCSLLKLQTFGTGGEMRCETGWVCADGFEICVQK